MDPSPTLQDFVLNLIYDPGARSAFELDPHGTLERAGLGDVTAADVQDVLPLVLDYAPLAGVSSIDGLSQVDDLTTGVANLDVAGAAAHLQTITAQLGGTVSHVTGDINLATAGAATVTADHLVSGVLSGGAGVYDGGLLGDGRLGLGGLDGLGLEGLGLDGLGLGGLGLGGAQDAGALTADHDPGVGLDVAVTTPVHQTVADVAVTADGLTASVSSTTAGTLDTTVNAVTGLTGSLGVDSALNLDVSGVHGATSSVVGGVLDTTGGLLPDGTGLDSTIAGVEHSVSGLTGAVGGLTGGLTGGGASTTEPDADHGVLGGLTGLHF
ncbi:IniB N-terminal domain-containing protein [Paractinoplanes rishiriensis]|uniref:Uncharacterized protein n=1 Tax=Paractinoplanes rishiriensis TaxID=1050105 RepID=A0A919JXY1_9ACTN|nr:IniB N-terminal domain-containing protein [Actinoplanes rishiriensis]GIE95545.1 hypothetical protein Ari01nite_30100 [Actinoplanes rishiriensis]